MEMDMDMDMEMNMDMDIDIDMKIYYVSIKFFFKMFFQCFICLCLIRLIFVLALYKQGSQK